MKWMVCFLVVCCLSLNSFAKDKGPVGRINSVQKGSTEDRDGNDVETLKINTIQSGTPFTGVMRVSMKLEGKNGKVSWAKAKSSHVGGAEVSGGRFKGSKATGAVTWNVKAQDKGLKRPKLKAYTVEYGYMKDGEFISLGEDFYKTDSAEELEEDNKESLPLDLKIGYIFTVS